MSVKFVRVFRSTQLWSKLTRDQHKLLLLTCTQKAASLSHLQGRKWTTSHPSTITWSDITPPPPPPPPTEEASSFVMFAHIWVALEEASERRYADRVPPEWPVALQTCRDPSARRHTGTWLHPPDWQTTLIATVHLQSHPPLFSSQPHCDLTAVHKTICIMIRASDTSLWILSGSLKAWSVMKGVITRFIQGGALTDAQSYLAKGLTRLIKIAHHQSWFPINESVSCS